MSDPSAPGAPRATLRLQLHRGFTFEQARQQVPYFAQLGISQFYLSFAFFANKYVAFACSTAH